MKQLQNLTAVKRDEIKTQADLDNMARIAGQHGFCFDMRAHGKRPLKNYIGDYVAVSAVAVCLLSMHFGDELNIISLKEFLSYDKGLPDEPQKQELNKMKQLKDLTAVKREEIKTQADLDSMARVATQHGFNMRVQDELVLEDYIDDYVMLYLGTGRLQQTNDKNGLNIISLEEFLAYDKGLLDAPRYTEGMRLNNEMPKIGDKVILNFLKGSWAVADCEYAHNGEVMEVAGISKEGNGAHLKSTESKFECSINNAHFRAMDWDRSEIYIPEPQEQALKTYEREIIGKCGTKVIVDVYRVLDGFSTGNPILDHISKKSLCAGMRGHKDLMTDLLNIKESIEEAIELEGQR